MRKRLEPWLQSIWYGDKPAPLALRALSSLYRGVSGLRRQLYRNGWLASERAPLPVIVVGNLTVGGSGKTPTIIALANALRERGQRPGILSRGYGGGYRERWLPVTAASDPAQVGDEPVLMARATSAPVVVARRRIDGARALAGLDCSVVLADDGLQHYALQRDLEILVVHGNRRFGNRRLLPAGPLREVPTPGRFVLTIVNGGVAQAGEAALQTQLGPARSLKDGAQRALSSWSGQAVYAFAGIADPARFFQTLREHGLQVHGQAFPDHHHYTAGDLAFAANPTLDLLCTSKDAVKLDPSMHPSIWEVPLHSTLPDAVIDAVLTTLARLSDTST